MGTKGLVWSASAMGVLLHEGIGDTVRVSLTPDPGAPREHVEVMEKALIDAGVRHRLDFMDGALHGFAPPGGARYDRAASEKHWERVHDLFRRNLVTPAP